MLIDLGYVVVDVFGYKYYIHSCLSPSVWIWTKSTSMRGCWVASQYGPHLLVPLARLGHIEKQPSILACWLIFKNIPLGCPRGIFSHIHPSVDIQECISNRIIQLYMVTLSNLQRYNTKHRISSSDSLSLQVTWRPLPTQPDRDNLSPWLGGDPGSRHPPHPAALAPPGPGPGHQPPQQAICPGQQPTQ